MLKIVHFFAAALVCAGSVQAQSLTALAPGYTSEELFKSTPGFTITGLAIGPSRQVYFLETDSAFAASTKLYEWRADRPRSVLFDYGTAVFGSFVKVAAGRVYFGENSNSTIRAINLDGTLPQLIATVPGNYDLVIENGAAFVSANAGGFQPQNKVLSFDLATGATDAVLDAKDFSGPVALDPSGALVYGATNFAGVEDAYRFSAAQVASARGARELMLTPENRLFDNGSNAYLVFARRDTANGGRISDRYIGSNASTVNELIATTESNGEHSTAIRTLATSQQVVGHLAIEGTGVLVNVTDYVSQRSVVVALVPEPTCAMLIMFSVVGLAFRRRAG